MKAQKMRLLIPLVMVFMSLCVLPISAQRAKKSPKEPDRIPVANIQMDDPQAAATVEQLLQQTGQKYSTGAGVWIITRNGTNLRYFQLRLSHRAGTLITQVIISKGRSSGLGAAPNILRLANKLDYVKVGLDPDDDWFIRNESRLKSLDAEEFKTNLDRVAAAADRVYLELQQSR
jgi:hypothetical protein